MNKYIAVIFLLLIHPFVAAAGKGCSGKVTDIGVNSAGVVYATIKDGENVALKDVGVCDLHATEGRYFGEACKGALSILMSAEARQKSVILWFDESQFISCVQDWKSLSDMGMYHMKILE